MSRADLPIKATYIGVLGQVVAARRKGSDGRGGELDQATVAARAGLTQPQLSKIENGKLTPSVLQLRRIANALQTNPQTLLSDVEQAIKHLERNGIVIEYENTASNDAIILAGAVALGALVLVALSRK